MLFYLSEMCDVPTGRLEEVDDYKCKLNDGWPRHVHES